MKGARLSPRPSFSTDSTIACRSEYVTQVDRDALRILAVRDLETVGAEVAARRSVVVDLGVLAQEERPLGEVVLVADGVRLAVRLARGDRVQAAILGIHVLVDQLVVADGPDAVSYTHLRA